MKNIIDWFKKVFGPCEHEYGPEFWKQGILVKQCSKCNLLDIIQDPGLERNREIIRRAENILYGVPKNQNPPPIPEIKDECQHCETRQMRSEGNLWKPVIWMGYCFECWVKDKRCQLCFPGKGDGQHAMSGHQIPPMPDQKIRKP
jgi:hypothetical protein